MDEASKPHSRRQKVGTWKSSNPKPEKKGEPAYYILRPCPCSNFFRVYPKTLSAEGVRRWLGQLALEPDQISYSSGSAVPQLEVKEEKPRHASEPTLLDVVIIPAFGCARARRWPSKGRNHIGSCDEAPALDETPGYARGPRSRGQGYAHPWKRRAAFAGLRVCSNGCQCRRRALWRGGALGLDSPRHPGQHWCSAGPQQMLRPSRKQQQGGIQKSSNIIWEISQNQGP